MGNVKNLAEDYHLFGCDSDLAIETALDMECAVRSWAQYLQDSGRIYQ